MILIVNVPDMTTIVDIAKKLNISKSTVSRALTNSAGVSAKTRDLVLRTAKEMRYSANAYARSLVSRKSHMICFMIPDITDTFYQMMANSAETVLAKAGYSVFYKNVRRDPEEAMRFLQLAIEYNMDGVFITLDDWTDDICSMIESMTIPVISLRRRTPECLRGKVPYVDSDYDDIIHPNCCRFFNHAQRSCNQCNSAQYGHGIIGAVFDFVCHVTNTRKIMGSRYQTPY